MPTSRTRHVPPSAPAHSHFDESGFPKPERHSVGVARQYCGRLGKVATGQVGVWLACVSRHGHALADARLSLPEVWTDDRGRRQRTEVPTEITCQSRAASAPALWQHTRVAAQLTARRVTGDEDCGKAPWPRDAFDGEGVYVGVLVERQP